MAERGITVFEIIKKVLENELDNLLYMVLAVIVICVAAFGDVSGPAAAMMATLFGALMIKIKGA